MGWPRPLEALRSRTARLAGLWLGVVLLLLVAGYLLLPFAVQLLVSALDVTMNIGVRIATPDSGADAWTIVMTIARAGLSALTSAWALLILGGLVVIGATALYGLQRLLGVEQEREVEQEQEEEEEEPSR